MARIILLPFIHNFNMAAIKMFLKKGPLQWLYVEDTFHSL